MALRPDDPHPQYLASALRGSTYVMNFFSGVVSLSMTDLLDIMPISGDRQQTTRRAGYA